MKKLLGRQVRIEELYFGRAVRDGQPSIHTWGGKITAVSGHMICLDVQTFSDPDYSNDPGCRERWFNTQASTFIAIEV